MNGYGHDMKQVDGEKFLFTAILGVKPPQDMTEIRDDIKHQKIEIKNTPKYSLQGTTQGRYLTGGV
ncbi:hypothetical protein, partial [Enterocloster citroniae]|uniref:hypothetical protein n=1 Tax=Enterocloster citroniae TaxID=358743 RepID=UPI00349EDA6F